MKRMPHSSAVMMIAFALALAGCGSKSGGESSGTTSTPSPAPAPDTAHAATLPAETTAVLAKSLYDAGPRASASPVNAALAAKGEKLFTSKGCTVCHGWGKKITGPDLKGVVNQRTAEWMQHQMLEPDVMTRTDPISHGLLLQYKIQMTNLRLTPEEAKSVIEYLKQREKKGS